MTNWVYLGGGLTNVYVKTNWPHRDGPFWPRVTEGRA